MATALPADVKYGYVADIIMRAVLDTPADPDGLPDGVPAKGTVTLQPVGTVFTAGGGRTGVVTSPYEFRVHQGLDETTPGAPVDAQYKGQLVNPATGRTGSHAVVAGWYTVAYKVDGYQKSYGPFHITEAFTEDNPFWIRENIPLEQTPQVKFVINEAILNEVRQIRDSLLEQGVPPGDAVSSVNGKTGDVVLTGDDIMLSEEVPLSVLDGFEGALQSVDNLRNDFWDELDEFAVKDHAHNIVDVYGLQGALDNKANIDDIPEQRVFGGRIFIQETPPTSPEPGDIHLW